MGSTRAGAFPSAAERLAAHAYMRPQAREHPVERIVGGRKTRAGACEDDMTADSDDARELAEARTRIADVFDHLEAARDVKTRIIERELLGICDEVLYPRHIRVERACVGNILAVEVTCDKMVRAPAEFAVDFAFTTTDIDHASNLGHAGDPIQGPQHPALPRAVGRQKKLIVHLFFTVY